jgi:hypothetical protein
VVERIDAILRILSVILTSDEEVAERALASEGTQADAMDRKHAELCKDLKTSQWRMLTASYGALMIKSSLLTEEEWAPKLPESEPSPGEAEASSGSNGEAESAGSNPSFSGEGKASQTPSNGHLTLEEFLMETDSPTLMQ